MSLLSCWLQVATFASDFFLFFHSISAILGSAEEKTVGSHCREGFLFCCSKHALGVNASLNIWEFCVRKVCWKFQKKIRNNFRKNSKTWSKNLWKTFRKPQDWFLLTQKMLIDALVITSRGILFLLKANWRFYASPSAVSTSNGADQMISSCDSFPKAVFSRLKREQLFRSVRCDSTFRADSRESPL